MIKKDELYIRCRDEEGNWKPMDVLTCPEEGFRAWVVDRLEELGLQIFRNVPGHSDETGSVPGKSQKMKTSDEVRTEQEAKEAETVGVDMAKEGSDKTVIDGEVVKEEKDESKPEVQE